MEPKILRISVHALGVEYVVYFYVRMVDFETCDDY